MDARTGYFTPDIHEGGVGGRVGGGGLGGEGGHSPATDRKVKPFV